MPERRINSRYSIIIRLVDAWNGFYHTPVFLSNICGRQYFYCNFKCHLIKYNIIKASNVFYL